MKKVFSDFQRLSFSTRLFIYLFAFTCLLLAVQGWYATTKIHEYLYSEVGTRAQVQAKQIAIIPALVDAVEHKDTERIAALVVRLKNRTDASYIVIGDAKGDHLFHTEISETRGPMVGGDNDQVLQGESTITIRKGTLGYSLRGKAPIINSHGDVIGIVSVGYLQEELNLVSWKLHQPVYLLLAGLFTVLAGFAWFFTRSIKRQTLGLEPEAIHWIVRQQEAILESIFEGVIVFGTDYKIAMINRAAREMLGLRASSDVLAGREIGSIIEQTAFFHSEDGATEDKYDEGCLFNSNHVIASRIRVTLDGQLQGWVVTFRDWNDINMLSTQLSQNRRYAESLRVMRHEHLNWLSTLAGLLYMKRFDEAVRLVQTHSEKNQKLLDYISNTFRNSAVAGLLLGKFYRAQELGLQLEFDPGCQFNGMPEAIGEIELMSIVGNLLDNAFDAVKDNATSKQIGLYLSDAGDDVVIEVSDQGSGIKAQIREHMFERGISSKRGADRGIGLYLVDSYVTQAGGVISVDDNEPQGAIFSVFIPKYIKQALIGSAQLGELDAGI